MTILAVSSGFANPKESALKPPRHENRQTDGTYILKTNSLTSIQAYYRDVRVGPLFLPTRKEWEDMRETCLALGEYWRPLGHILLHDSKGGEAYPLELCYNTAPNTDRVASLKCANLGLALLENKAAQREIVCRGRWTLRNDR